MRMIHSDYESLCEAESNLHVGLELIVSIEEKIGSNLGCRHCSERIGVFPPFDNARC